MLEVRAINAYYGAIHALRNVSLSVGRGKIVVLIGANGAGKTTLLKSVSGLIPNGTERSFTKRSRSRALCPERLWPWGSASFRREADLRSPPVLDTLKRGPISISTDGTETKSGQGWTKSSRSSRF